MRHLAPALLILSLPVLLPAQGGERPAVSAPVTALAFDVSAGVRETVAATLAVTARFQVADRSPVLLSMPAWTPGAYEIADFARQVSGFTARQGGRELRWDKRDPDTWRITPAGPGLVELTYRVRVDSLDTSRAWSRGDFTFFNGTAVFLYVEGRPATPAAVRVRTESDWRVATGMTPGDSARSYRASDVHDLMDHPFFVGRFDLDSTRVAERWMRLATYPSGSVSGQRRAALWQSLSRSVPPLAAVFGEVPWRTYTVLQVVEPGFPGMSALEHAESELAIVGADYLGEGFVQLIHAHELAHAWNVKRLRPADLLPYRYDAAQPTSWLWMSEGITDYYADLALVRAALIDETAFLASTLEKIDEVRALPPTSLEDASLQAWLGMRDGTADLYYGKGALAGLGLDILIRDASDGTKSLDDVMRELWKGPAKAGRGFTHDDFWNAVTRAAGGKSLNGFEQRFIDGREAFPWDEWLAKAGWRIVTDSISEPRLGALLRADPKGVLVAALDSSGAGARAGLAEGDVITAIGGRPTLDPSFGERWREYWGKRPGAAMALEVLRGGATRTLEATVEVTTHIDRHVEPDPNATARAKRVRAGILRGPAPLPARP